MPNENGHDPMAKHESRFLPDAFLEVTFRVLLRSTTLFMRHTAIDVFS